MSKIRLQRFQLLPMNVCLLLLLMSCGTSNDLGVPHLPDTPPNLKACIGEAVPALPGARGTPLGRAGATGALGDQRKSALAKDRCGRDYDSWYQDLRNSLADPKQGINQ